MAEMHTDSLDLLVDPFIASSGMFPSPGAVAANQFGSVSTK